MNTSRSSLWLIAASLFSIISIANAATLRTTKLFGTPQPVTPMVPIFGASVALSDRWLVVGEPGNDDAYEDCGAVRVFDARTGRRVRVIFADDAPVPRLFGYAVALSGNLLVVGAPFDAADGVFAGAAYVFDLRTGQQLFVLRPTDPAPDRWFGMRVAMADNLILIGAPLDDTLGNNAGAAYIFDSRTGGQLHKLMASDGAAGHEFGMSLALSGRTALIGSPEADGSLAGSGAAYVFDAGSGFEVRKLNSLISFGTERFGAAVDLHGSLAMVGAPEYPMLAANAGAVFFFNIDTGLELASVLNLPYGAAEERFGEAVALDDGVAIAGGPLANGTRGAAYQIDLRTGVVMDRFEAADGDPNDRFGLSVSTHAGHALFSSRGDDDLGTDSGAVYWTRPLAGTPDLEVSLRTTDPAPDVPFAVFRQTTHGLINRLGSTISAASLAGAGAAAGRNQGVWSSLGAPGSQSLMLRSRDPLDSLGPEFAGVLAGRVSTGPMNQDALAVLRVNLAGAGNGHQAILRHNGTDIVPIVRTGHPEGILAGASVRGIAEVAQNRDPVSPRLAMPVFLRHQAGVVGAENDSLLLFANNVTGALIDAAASEGVGAPGGGTFGQFTGRVAYNLGVAVFPSHRLTPGTPAIPGLFRRQPFGVLDTVVDSGVAAPGAGGAVFRSFIGEGVSGGDQALFRATLSGAGVTAPDNEGLWHQALGLVARKGDQVPGEEAGVTWRRFLGFWPVDNNGMMIYAAVRDPAPPARQIPGLWILQEDGSLLNLFRPNLSAGTRDGARISRLLRVDVDLLSGRYAVLAALTGTPARNQALFVGNLAVGDPVNATAVRLPRLLLRKGAYVASPGGNAWDARSLSLPVTTDRAGSGAKGLGQVINPRGQVAVRILRSDRTSAIARAQEATLQP